MKVSQQILITFLIKRSSKMKKIQSKRTAFTLIELLVITAIIAITTRSSIKVKQW